MPVSISGFNSDIDTAALTKELVELEHKPIARMEREKEIIKMQKNAWSDLKNKLQQLESVLKKLYGFRRVFKERKVYSDQEDYISSSVLANAEMGEHTIEIKNLAQAHKITTDKIKTDKKLPGAVFSIQVGEDKIEISGFKNGGTINKLSDVLKEEASDILKIQKLKADQDHIILSLEALKTGKNYFINIIDDKENTKKLMKELGLISVEKPTALYFDFNDRKPAQLSFTDNGFKNTPGLFLKSKTSLTLPVNKNITQGTMELAYVSVEPQAVEQLSGTTIRQKTIDPIQIKDITIYGAEIIINKRKSHEIIPEKGSISIEIRDSKNHAMTINLKMTNHWTTLQSELSDLENIQSIHFINNSGSHFMTKLKKYLKMLYRIQKMPD